jgi:hypothetical protein
MSAIATGIRFLRSYGIGTLMLARGEAQPAGHGTPPPRNSRPAQRRSAPIAIRGALRAIDAAWYSPPGEGFEVGLEGQIQCLGSEDLRDARSAFARGRRPVWRGR